jgi:hypothetical protein
MSNGAAATARRRQQQQEAQEELQRRLQEKFSKHVRDFPINLEFPAKVSSSSSTTASDDKPIRTDTDLIQHRLLEAGVFGTGGSNDRQTVTEVTEAASNFISIMNRSGCYNSVQVKVCGGSSSAEEEEDEGKESLNIVLNEKKWYRLYIGGGLKHEGGLEALETESGSFPKVQFETSGSLLNLTGRLDTTSLQYAVDQTSSTTLSFSHERPLYTVLVENGPLQELLLTSRNNNGSQASIAFRAVLDTLDHEGTRSYKEYQRLLSLRIANTSNVSMPESVRRTTVMMERKFVHFFSFRRCMDYIVPLSHIHIHFVVFFIWPQVEGGYSGLNWSLNFRDLIPRRHASLPYAMDASPEIVSQSGPSLKHSLSYEYRTNGRDCDDRFNPTVGVDVHGKVEVAGPPGDVGFVRMQGGASWNVVPLPPDGTWALHGSIQAGILRSLAFGGLCGPASISDRFFVGGPMQLRGFVPAGIGPRAKTVSKRLVWMLDFANCVFYSFSERFFSFSLFMLNYIGRGLMPGR